MKHLMLTMVLLVAVVKIDAAAHTMPADKLMRLSNRELCIRGQQHWDKNELDSALICFNIVANRSYKNLSKEEMECVCRASISMAKIYSTRFYDFERAINCLMNSEKIAINNNIESCLAGIYELMAIIETMKNDIERDFEFSSKAFELHRKAFNYSLKYKSSQETTANIIINLATLALVDHKYSSIQEELNLFQRIREDNNAPTDQFARSLIKAVTFAYNHQYDSALYQLNQLNKPLSMPAHAWTSKLIIAHQTAYFIYWDMGNYSAALHELSIMEKHAQEQEETFAIIEILLLKRNLFSVVGKTDLANEYDLKYHKAKDKFMADAKVMKVEEEKVLFKLNEANHEIKELSYKQRIQQTQLIAVAVVAILLLALLTLWYILYRRTKEKNRSLYLRNQMLLANADRMRWMRQEHGKHTAGTSVGKYGRGKMEGDDIAQVMAKVERIMDESKEIYSVGFSLNRLAELTGETESRVSQAINTSGRKFYELLNEYRVQEACRRMNDKTRYSNLTIEAIGQSVGFKSRSNFVATFKRLTGLTPSAYIKQLSKTLPPSVTSIVE